MTISKCWCILGCYIGKMSIRPGGGGIIIRAVPLGFEAGADLVNKVAILVDKPACCDAARDATCDAS